MPTRVVHCKRERFDLYIGRPSRFGNPFVVGRHRTREECLDHYREWLQTQPRLVAELPRLRGKVLGCWCTPWPCHGDVLAELADALPQSR